MKTTYNASNMTIGEWLDEWFRRYSVPRIRANTQVSYQRFIDITKSELGHIKLCELTIAEVQQMLFKRFSLCHRSAQLLKVILAIAMNRAVAEGLIVKSPIDGVVLPRRSTSYVFSKMVDDDWQRLIAANPRCFFWEMLLTLEYMTGMRRSELLGLKWKDISVRRNSSGVILNGRITVRRALIIGLKDPSSGRRQLVLAGTKSRSGTRSLLIPNNLCAILMDYKEKQSARMNKTLSSESVPERFVFCRPNGNPIHPSTFSSLFSKIRKRLGISSTFHMLRHDFACRMKKSHRFDFKDIQVQMGHSSIKTTLDIYTHIDDTDRSEVSDWLGEELDIMLERKN